MLELVGVVFLIVVKNREDRLARYLVALNKQNQTEARSHRILLVCTCLIPDPLRCVIFESTAAGKYFLLWKGLDKIQPISL